MTKYVYQFKGYQTHFGGVSVLCPARNDGVDLERASATWSTSSFTSYHGQLLSLAVQWGVAIEIERAIKKSASFC